MITVAGLGDNAEMPVFSALRTVIFVMFSSDAPSSTPVSVT
jgi:hypothetical protein